MTADLFLGFKGDRLQFSISWEETDRLELKPVFQHHILPVAAPKYSIWQASWLRFTARYQRRYK